MKYLYVSICFFLVSLQSLSQLINYETWEIATHKIKEITILKINVTDSKSDTTIDYILLYDTSGKLAEKKESFNNDKTAYISSKYKYYYVGRKSVTEIEHVNPYSLRSDHASLPVGKKSEWYDNRLLVKRELEYENGEKERQEFFYDNNKLLKKSTIYIDNKIKLTYTLSYTFY